MLYDVEKGNNLVLTRLIPVTTPAIVAREFYTLR